MRKLSLSDGVVVCGVLIALVLQLYVNRGEGQSESNCKGCHSGKKAGSLGLKDVYALIAGHKVSHEGIEENCAGCHLLRKGLNAGTVRESGDSDYQTKSVFFLRGLSRDGHYELVLGFKDRAGRSSASSFKFRPYKAVLRRGNNDEIPPSVSNVRVAEVTKKVFLNALVRWETDKPSAGFVEYGSGGGYTERVSFEDVFETRHSVNLPGLRSGAYRFRIISMDIFGNTSVSGEYKLDSSKTYFEGRAQHHFPPSAQPVLTSIDTESGAGRAAKAEDAVFARPEARIFRLDSTGDVYVEVLSSLPVKASLKLTEQIEFGSHGIGLTPGRFSRIEACRACHPQNASHPVAIRSAGAPVAVPFEMPTVEGGLITCVTCHHPHGGGADYFLRFDRDGELCEKCHRDGVPS